LNSGPIQTPMRCTCSSISCSGKSATSAYRICLVCFYRYDSNLSRWNI